jgi:Co/Zn/Cd efflux system component
MDPACSVASAFVIFYTGWGVTKAAGWILLQAAPHTVHAADLSAAVLDIDDVVDVHEVHVWQLVDNLSVATMHIVLRPGTDLKRVNSVVDDVRRVLHRHRIHISTIQQEVAGNNDRQSIFSGECAISKVTD